MKKINNPVAKHSRNKSGAGAHKSEKDYSRKMKHKSEYPESIANKIEETLNSNIILAKNRTKITN